jgi:hypothetical protein
MWEPLKQITGRWLGSPLPAAEEELLKLLRQAQDEQPDATSGATSVVSYLSYVQQRAADQGVSIGEVLRHDKEQKFLNDEENLSQYECLGPSEIEHFVRSAADPAHGAPLPFCRLAHLNACVACQTRTATACSSDPQQVKALAADRDAAEKLKWELESQPPQSAGSEG